MTQPTENQTPGIPRENLQTIRRSLRQVVIGQQHVIDQVLMAFLAGGHVLVEGVPGLGKTLLVRALAKATGGGFSRIQFTPDLMPSDVTGHAIYNMNDRKFEVRKGPVFTNLLLADEINRAPAKTQAALLEVMQERQVTIEGTSFVLEKPFLVMATQNPIEQEGTYPLPEAELDRFMFKVHIGYPGAEDESALVSAVTGLQKNEDYLATLEPLVTIADVLALQQEVQAVTVDPAVVDYAVSVVRATRDWRGIQRGAGPRGSIWLIHAARARAYLEQRDYVSPDDIKQVAAPVLRHRLLLTADMEIEGVPVDQVLNDILEQTAAPRQ